MKDLIQLRYELKQDSIQAALEQSRRGGHLWIFADTPLLAADCRIYIYDLALRLGIPVQGGGLRQGIEVFPKQDSLEGRASGRAALRPGDAAEDGSGLGPVALLPPQLRQGTRRPVRLLCQPASLSGGRVRTVAVPVWVKQGVNAWTTAAGLEEGKLLRPVLKSGKVVGEMSFSANE
jgi:hypothetical protein